MTRAALYEPQTGKVACVLVQAACGGDGAVAHMLPVEDWNTGPPHESAAKFEATEEEWRMLASLPREARIRMFNKETV